MVREAEVRQANNNNINNINNNNNNNNNRRSINRKETGNILLCLYNGIGLCKKLKMIYFIY